MPELPEVETFRDYFQSTALHQKIRTTSVRCPDLLDGIAEKTLRQKLSGQEFHAAVRHGKHLFVETDNGWLTIHFGMTGFLRYYREPDQSPGYICLETEFENGYRFAYDCRRKLGRFGWADDPEEFIADRKLGPDPFGDDFDDEIFNKILDHRRGSIKGMLMNQEALAGIGNLYSDEILFQAGISPERKVDDLEQKERRKLFDCLMDVLETAIEFRAGEKGWPEKWLVPRREPGEECPLCGGEIERVKVSGRNGYRCREHQE